MQKPALLLGGVLVLAAASVVAFLVSGDSLSLGPKTGAERRAAARSGGDASSAEKHSRPLVELLPAQGRPGEAAAGGYFEQRQRLERAGYEAANHLDGALAELSRLTAPQDRTAFLRGLFERLGEGDCKAAMAALKQLREPDRFAAARLLVESWYPDLAEKLPGAVGTNAFVEAIRGEHDVSAAKRLLAYQADMTMAISSSGGLAGLGYSLLEKDPVLAADWAREVSGPEGRDLLNRAAHEIAEQNPQQALELGAGLTGKEQTDFLRHVAHGWAQTKPADAFAWAETNPDSALRAALLNSATRGLARKDPDAAAEKLNLLPPGDDRQRTITEIAQGWAAADPLAAEQWAEGLGAPKEKEVALAKINEVAPVGVGVVLRSGADGGFVIGDVVAGSPAAVSGGLLKGDRIVGITNAQGQMTDVSKLAGDDMSKLVAAIRGDRGTSVTLQVIGDGNSQPRSVTIVRNRFASGRVQ